MKIVIISVSSLFLLWGCHSSEFKNELERENLRGKVKTIRRTPYKAVEKYGEVTKGEIDRGWFTDYSYRIFNEKGNLIENQDFYSSGELMDKTIYKYDNFNKIEEEIVSGSDGDIKKKITFRYDEKANLIRKTEYKPDGSLIVKENYKYNERDKVIEVQDINSEGVPADRWIYKYNNKGKRIEANRYKPDGNLYEKIIYDYDNEGNIVEVNRFGENGNLEGRIYYVYDNKNDLIEAESYDSNGELEAKLFYKFISKFNPKKFNKYVNMLAMESDVTIYEVLIFGRIGIEELQLFIADESLDINGKYEYEFDKQDNWIKRIEFEDDSAKFVVEREITYYEQGFSEIIDNLRDKFRL